MAQVKPIDTPDLWRRRLYLPLYKIGEAARYARTSTQTAARWHGTGSGKVLPERKARSEFSYMQLIEFAVVAAMRREKIRLSKIKCAREYFAETFHSEFPFAEYRFKTDGIELIADYGQIDPEAGMGKLLYATKGGQLGWNEILGRRLREFEYDDEGIAVRWHVGGSDSPILIDPRVSFGAPAVSGAATWAIKGRWDAGESIRDIANDFELSQDNVVEALAFEGVQPDYNRQDLWAN